MKSNFRLFFSKKTPQIVGQCFKNFNPQFDAAYGTN